MIEALPPKESSHLDSEVMRQGNVIAHQERRVSAKFDSESDELNMKGWKISNAFVDTLKRIAQESTQRMKQGAVDKEIV